MILNHDEVELKAKSIETVGYLKTRINKDYGIALMS